jgi:hypothetical protein
MFVAGGCSKDDTVAPQTTAVPTADSDVFETVIAAIGEDNGGVVDLAGDMAAAADDIDSFPVSAKIIAGVGVPAFDSVTGTWQVQITRQKGNPAEPSHATYMRTYRYQYRNQSGETLQHRVNGADTAYSIHFEVMEGSGTGHTSRIAQQIMSMVGTLEATGVNTDTIVINGTCTRTGVDTLLSYQSVRTLEYQLELTFANVRCLRAQTQDISQQIKGDLNGSFMANVSFMSGYTYGETNIVRTMAVVIGVGHATVSIGDGTYTGDLATGTP